MSPSNSSDNGGSDWLSISSSMIPSAPGPGLRPQPLPPFPNQPLQQHQSIVQPPRQQSHHQHRQRNHQHYSNNRNHQNRNHQSRNHHTLGVAGQNQYHPNYNHHVNRQYHHSRNKAHSHHDHHQTHHTHQKIYRQHLQQHYSQSRRTQNDTMRMGAQAHSQGKGFWEACTAKYKDTDCHGHPQNGNQIDSRFQSLSPTLSKAIPPSVACLSPFGFDPSIANASLHFVSEACENEEAKVFVSIGKIIGKLSAKRISLPIFTPALLEQSNDCRFIEEVKKEKKNELLSSIIGCMKEQYVISGGYLYEEVEDNMENDGADFDDDDDDDDGGDVGVAACRRWEDNFDENPMRRKKKRVKEIPSSFCYRRWLEREQKWSPPSMPRSKENTPTIRKKQHNRKERQAIKTKNKNEVGDSGSSTDSDANEDKVSDSDSVGSSSSSNGDTSSSDSDKSDDNDDTDKSERKNRQEDDDDKKNDGNDKKNDGDKNHGSKPSNKKRRATSHQQRAGAGAGDDAARLDRDVDNGGDNDEIEVVRYQSLGNCSIYRPESHQHILLAGLTESVFHFDSDSEYHGQHHIDQNGSRLDQRRGPTSSPTYKRIISHLMKDAKAKITRRIYRRVRCWTYNKSDVGIGTKDRGRGGHREHRRPYESLPLWHLQMIEEGELTNTDIEAAPFFLSSISEASPSSKDDSNGRIKSNELSSKRDDAQTTANYSSLWTSEEMENYGDSKRIYLRLFVNEKRLHAAHREMMMEMERRNVEIASEAQEGAVPDAISGCRDDGDNTNDMNMDASGELRESSINHGHHDHDRDLDKFSPSSPCWVGVFRALISGLLENAFSLAQLLDEPVDSLSSGSQISSFFFPHYFGDITESARIHYNQKKILRAGLSGIEALRLYNNQVKRMLVELYVPSRSTLLDLACGHGQDLLKFCDNGVRRYIGIDIAEDAIEEARRRCRHRDTQRKLDSKKMYVEFHVGNLLREKTYRRLNNELFDVVSIQLAIHYMMESEQTARLFLSYVYHHLRMNGVFIGTTVCCEAIARRIRGIKRIPPQSKSRSTAGLEGDSDTVGSDNSGGHVDEWEYFFGNSLYSVTFDSLTLERLRDGVVDTGESEDAPLLNDDHKEGGKNTRTRKGDDANYHDDIGGNSGSGRGGTDSTESFLSKLHNEWGISYRYWLAETIDQREFVVPWTAFCRLAESMGFKVQLCLPFPQFFDAAASSQHQPFFQWLSSLSQRNKSYLDDNQYEVFSLHQAFVLRKVGVPKKNEKIGGTGDVGGAGAVDQGSGLPGPGLHADSSSARKLSEIKGLSVEAIIKAHKKDADSIRSFCTTPPRILLSQILPFGPWGYGSGVGRSRIGNATLFPPYVQQSPPLNMDRSTARTSVLTGGVSLRRKSRNQHQSPHPYNHSSFSSNQEALVPNQFQDKNFISHPYHRQQYQQHQAQHGYQQYQHQQNLFHQANPHHHHHHYQHDPPHHASHLYPHFSDNLYTQKNHIDGNSQQIVASSSQPPPPPSPTSSISSSHTSTSSSSSTSSHSPPSASPPSVTTQVSLELSHEGGTLDESGLLGIATGENTNVSIAGHVLGDADHVGGVAPDVRVDVVADGDNSREQHTKKPADGKKGISEEKARGRGGRGGGRGRSKAAVGDSPCAVGDAASSHANPSPSSIEVSPQGGMTSKDRGKGRGRGRGRGRKGENSALGSLSGDGGDGSVSGDGGEAAGMSGSGDEEINEGKKKKATEKERETRTKEDDGIAERNSSAGGGARSRGRGRGRGMSRGSNSIAGGDVGKDEIDVEEGGGSSSSSCSITSSSGSSNKERDGEGEGRSMAHEVQGLADVGGESDSAQGSDTIDCGRKDTEEVGRPHGKRGFKRNAGSSDIDLKVDGDRNNTEHGNYGAGAQKVPRIHRGVEKMDGGRDRCVVTDSAESFLERERKNVYGRDGEEGVHHDTRRSDHPALHDNDASEDPYDIKLREAGEDEEEDDEEGSLDGSRSCGGNDAVCSDTPVTNVPIVTIDSRNNKSGVGQSACIEFSIAPLNTTEQDHNTEKEIEQVLLLGSVLTVAPDSDAVGVGVGQDPRGRAGGGSRGQNGDGRNNYDGDENGERGSRSRSVSSQSNKSSSSSSSSVTSSMSSRLSSAEGLYPSDE